VKDQSCPSNRKIDDLRYATVETQWEGRSKDDIEPVDLPKKTSIEALLGQSLYDVYRAFLSVSMQS